MGYATLYIPHFRGNTDVVHLNEDLFSVSLTTVMPRPYDEIPCTAKIFPMMEYSPVKACFRFFDVL